MTDIFEQARKVINEDEAARIKEQALAAERIRTAAQNREAEKQIAKKAQKEILAFDEKIAPALEGFARQFDKDDLQYTRQEVSDGILYAFAARNIKPLNIGLRAAFNGASGIDKEIVGIECYIDDCEHSPEQACPDTEREQSADWDIVTSREFYRDRTVHSAPTDEAITEALSRWFVAAVEKNRALRDLVKAGKVSGAITFGLAPSEKPSNEVIEKVNLGRKITDRRHDFSSDPTR